MALVLNKREAFRFGASRIYESSYAAVILIALWGQVDCSQGCGGSWRCTFVVVTTLLGPPRHGPRRGEEHC